MNDYARIVLNDRLKGLLQTQEQQEGFVKIQEENLAEAKRNLQLTNDRIKDIEAALGDK